MKLASRTEQWFSIVYPEKQMVSSATIIGWAKDYLATEYMANNPHADDAAIEENARVTSVLEAMDILSDAGTVTFTQEARDTAEGLL
jgi:hypothetical protein